MSPVFLTCVFLALFISVTDGQRGDRCFDCNSGIHWTHENCPADGNLNTERLTTVMCPGPCFVKNDVNFPGTIFRGCSSWYWLADYEPLPENGCIEDAKGNQWCFCTGNECNTMAMEQGETNYYYY